MHWPDDLTTALAHVRWIGGGSGAGKSTVAARLTATRDAILYDTDARMGDHAARCTDAGCPHLAAFRRMDMDTRWVHRTPRDMLETFHWFAGEGFDLIVEDLLALPRDGPVIVDGFRLLPRCVAPLLRSPRQAVWLLPTPAFRRRAFEARGTIWDIPSKTSDPERALANMLARDALFTARLRRETGDLGLHVIEVDGTLSETQLTAQVEQWVFGPK